MAEMTIRVERGQVVMRMLPWEAWGLGSQIDWLMGLAGVENIGLANLVRSLQAAGEYARKRAEEKEQEQDLCED